MMNHVSNMDEDLNKESNTSKEANSSTEEEDTGPKTATQQRPLITSERMTLQTLPRPTRGDSEAMEDENGILVHGPSCLGPRTLLYIIDNPLEVVVKVSHSAGSTDQNKTLLQACSDQLT